MSVATLITNGLGSFGSVPLLLLDGLGAFGGPTAAGGIDWENWAKPPEGYRRVLDTSGVDPAVQEQARLDALRREIGIIKDPEPVAEPPASPEMARVAARRVLDDLERVAREREQAEVAAAAAAAKLKAAAAEVQRLEAIERDAEEALLLMAAAI